MSDAAPKYQIVTLPDGSEGQFPPDWGPEEIQRSVREQFPESRFLEGAEPKEPIPESESAAPMTSSIAGGTLRGLAGTLDLPTRGVDWVSRKLFGYTPQGSPTPFTDLADAYGPAPVRGYETTRNISEIAGPIAVESAITGGAGLPAALAAGGLRSAPRVALRTLGGITRRTGQGLAMTGVGAAGGAGAGEVAKEIGLGETGQELAGTAGSLLAPFAAGRGARTVGRSMLLDANSPQRLRAAEAAGVTPSIGLVGSKFGSLLEDMTAGVPFGGGPAYAMRRQQYADMDAAAQRAAELARGGPSTGPISEGSVGQRVQSTAEQAHQTNRAEISGSQEALSQAVGPATPVRDFPLLEQMGQMQRERGNAAPFVKDVLAAHQGELNRARNIPIDPALANRLDRYSAMLDAAERRSAGQNMPVDPRLVQLRNAIERRRFENTGTPYGELKDWRSDLGQDITGTGRRLPNKLRDPAYATTTDLMRQHAEQRGVPSDIFDAIQENTRRREGENAVLDPLVTQQNPGASYNQLFSPTNEQNINLLDVLQRRAPTPLARTLADNLELQTRGTSAGSGVPNPETTNPRAISAWWSGLSEEARNAYAPPGSRQRTIMDGLSETAAADTRRPTRTLPGKGGNTLGAPVIMGLQGSGLGASLLSGQLLPAAVMASPSFLAQGLGRITTNPNITRSLVNPARPFLDTSQILPAIRGLRGYEGQTP